MRYVGRDPKRLTHIKEVREVIHSPLVRVDRSSTRLCHSSLGRYSCHFAIQPATRTYKLLSRGRFCGMGMLPPIHRFQGLIRFRRSKCDSKTVTAGLFRSERPANCSPETYRPCYRLNREIVLSALSSVFKFILAASLPCACREMRNCFRMLNTCQDVPRGFRLSVARDASINRQNVAGNIVGSSRCQEDHCAFQVIRPPEPAQWNLLQDTIALVV